MSSSQGRDLSEGTETFSASNLLIPIHMDLKTLTVRNAATVQILQTSPKPVPITGNPFFGYFEVTLFECPQFLMFTNNDCPRSWNILFDGKFETHSMKIWCRLAKTATGILDIGAHVGVYSLCAAALRSDIKIHAFEPNPHAYTRLRVNRGVNSFDQIVEHTFAVGDKNEYVPFSWVKKPTLQIASGAGVGESTRTDIERIVVPMGALDGTGLAGSLGSKPLVKIDVEGGEAATINGMLEVLNLRPDIILETFSAKSCDVMNTVLMPLGYRVFLIRENHATMVPREKLQACDLAGEDFNQLLTLRTDDELRQLGLF